eukprot:Phypoly_transcript_01356.p2 GENE.Phypoly_transcript_01356~~Phypoly_transcript_01356.p2  ORF type:complete len:348 (+),score=84.16 Phypoly_transcript_01356:1650-2693(+)
MRTEKKRGRKPMEWRRRQREALKNNNSNHSSFFELSGKKKPRRKPNSNNNNDNNKNDLEPTGNDHPQNNQTQQMQQLTQIQQTQQAQSSQQTSPPMQMQASAYTQQHYTQDTALVDHPAAIPPPTDTGPTNHVQPTPIPSATFLGNNSNKSLLSGPSPSSPASFATTTPNTIPTATSDSVPPTKKEQADLRRANKKKKKMLSSKKTARSRRKRYGRGSYLCEILGEFQYSDVVTKTCKVLAYFSRYAEAAEIIHDAITNANFSDKSKVPPLRFLAVGIAFNNDDFVLAFDSVKFVCTQRPYSIPIWNLYNKIMFKYPLPPSPIHFSPFPHPPPHPSPVRLPPPLLEN